MAIQRTLQSIMLGVIVIAALVFVGRGLVYVTGGNAIVGAFSESERGGCPQTDNCVSSYATGEQWAIDPIACTAPRDQIAAVGHDAVVALGNVEVIEPGASYIARSRLLRFPDDVRLETSSRGLEVLSSSRLGAGDMGVNRGRVETIRDTVAADLRC